MLGMPEKCTWSLLEGTDRVLQLEETKKKNSSVLTTNLPRYVCIKRRIVAQKRNQSPLYVHVVEDQWYRGAVFSSKHSGNFVIIHGIIQERKTGRPKMKIRLPIPRSYNCAMVGSIQNMHLDPHKNGLLTIQWSFWQDYPNDQS